MTGRVYILYDILLCAIGGWRRLLGCSQNAFSYMRITTLQAGASTLSVYYESPLGAVEERILNVMYNLLVCCREQKEDEQSRSRARAFGFACICRF